MIIAINNEFYIILFINGYITFIFLNYFYDIDKIIYKNTYDIITYSSYYLIKFSYISIDYIIIGLSNFFKFIYEIIEYIINFNLKSQLNKEKLINDELRLEINKQKIINLKLNYQLNSYLNQNNYKCYICYENKISKCCFLVNTHIVSLITEEFIKCLINIYL
jgi:hypothetical protein